MPGPADQPRSARRSRPAPGLIVMGGLGAIMAILVVAAYHGSTRTHDPGCAPAAPVLRRTQADVAGARQALTTTAVLPAADVSALRRDAGDLAAFLADHPSLDEAFTDRVAPLSGELGQVVADAHAPVRRTTADLTTLGADTASAARYCAITS